MAGYFRFAALYLTALVVLGLAFVKLGGIGLLMALALAAWTSFGYRQMRWRSSGASWKGAARLLVMSAFWPLIARMR